MKTLLWIISVALLATACSTTRTTTSTQPFTPDAIATMLHQRNNGLVSLQADGTLYTSMRGSSNQASFSYSLYKTDSLLLTIYGPFGIVVGKLQANPTGFYYFDAMINEGYEGQPTRENFERLLHIPLAHREMALLLRGEPPHDFSEYSFVEREDGIPTFVRKGETTNERLVFSPSDRALTEYSQHDKNGKLVALVRYTEFSHISDFSLAQKVTFQFPQAQISVNLQSRTIEPNVESRQYSFSIPRGVKRNRY